MQGAKVDSRMGIQYYPGMRTIAELVKAHEERLSRRREIRRLHEEEHLSYAEIGARMKISRQRVYELIHDDPGWEEERETA